MIRLYITTTVPEARQILAHGFSDVHQVDESHGVLVSEQPMGENDRVEGFVVLAIELPLQMYRVHQLKETDPDDPSGTREMRTWKAVIPAALLNQHLPAQVYDHEYAGSSRRELLDAIHKWEQAGQPENAACRLSSLTTG